MDISIIVPTLNEESVLPTCLGTLMPQLSPRDEVIVVDAGSTDHTIHIATSYGCRVLLYPESTRGQARDYGTKSAKNEIILQTDADVIWTPNFIFKLRSHYQNYDVIGVSGGWRDAKGRILGQLTTAIIEHVLQYADCIQSYRRTIYPLTHGHPHINYGEQVLLWLEIRRMGPTIYDPSMFVYHLSDGQVRIPAYMIGGGLLGAGALQELTIGGETGYALIGTGAGFSLGQLGSDLIKSSNPNHFHHYHLGLMIAALGATVYGMGGHKDLSCGLIGLGAGLFTHDVLTESGVV